MILQIAGYKLTDRHPWKTGGMADLFRAVRRVDNEGVVIKVLKEEFRANKDVKKAFEYEYRYAHSLGRMNDHMAPAYEFGTLRDGRLFFSIRYIPSEDVHTLVKRAQKHKTRVSLRLACHIVQQTADVLDALHHFPGRPLIHRDISADNILVEADTSQVEYERERIYLIDFGIATGLEGEYVPAGKPEYTPPEGFHYPTPAHDVYSLGIVLFFILAGHMPYHKTNPRVYTGNVHTGEKAPSIHKYRQDIPDWLDSLVAEMLAVKPAERPPAGKVRDTLAQNKIKMVNPGEIDVVLSSFHTPKSLPAVKKPLVRIIKAALLVTAGLLLISGLAAAIIRLLNVKPDPHKPFHFESNRNYMTNLVQGVELPARHFRITKEADVFDNVISKKIAPIKKDGVYAYYEVAGVWGGTNSYRCEYNEHAYDNKIVFPDPPVMIELAAHPVRTVYAPAARIKLPLGVKVSCTNYAVAARSNGIHEIQLKWGERLVIKYGNPAGKQYSGIVTIMDLKALERGGAGGSTFNGKPLIFNASDLQPACRKYRSDRADAAWNDDLRLRWGTVSVETPPSQSTTTSRPPTPAISSPSPSPSIVASVAVILKGPGWPGLLVKEISSADYIAYMKDGIAAELASGSNILTGIPWGATATLVLSNKSGLAAATNVLLEPPNGVEMLIGVTPGMDKASVSRALDSWARYVKADLLNPLRPPIPPPPTNSADWTAKSVLTLDLSEDGKPRWPRVKRTPSVSSEMVEWMDQNDYGHNAEVNPELAGIRWGTTGVQYHVISREGRKVKNLDIASPDIVALCRLDAWEQSLALPGYFSDLKSWHDTYLTDDLKLRLEDEVGRRFENSITNVTNPAALTNLWGSISPLLGQHRERLSGDVLSRIGDLMHQQLKTIIRTRDRRKMEYELQQWLASATGTDQLFESAFSKIALIKDDIKKVRKALSEGKD